MRVVHYIAMTTASCLSRASDIAASPGFKPKWDRMRPRQQEFRRDRWAKVDILLHLHSFVLQPARGFELGFASRSPSLLLVIRQQSQANLLLKEVKYIAVTYDVSLSYWIAAVNMLEAMLK